MLYISWVLGLITLMGTGMLWYSKFLFGKKWFALQGVAFGETAGKKKMAVGILMNIIISGTINWLAIQNNLNLLGAVELSLFLWAGFLAPFHAQEVIFGKKPLALFWIDSGYQLIGLLLVSLISAQLVG